MDKFIELLSASPELANGVISGEVEKYKPVLYAVLRELFGLFKDLVNNDEYYEVCAKSNRKRFMALVNEGFSEDQAMAIMLASMEQFRNYARTTSGSSIKLNK